MRGRTAGLHEVPHGLPEGPKEDRVTQDSGWTTHLSLAAQSLAPASRSTERGDGGSIDPHPTLWCLRPFCQVTLTSHGLQEGLFHPHSPTHAAR